MNRRLRKLVRDRARNRCEYCHLPQALLPLARFHVDHIIASQHQANDDPAGLCYSCDRCNLSKGPNLSGIDPFSGKIVVLFNPRRQRWNKHFRWEEAVLVGLTKVGRATIAVLGINSPERLYLRQHLLALGQFPIDF